MPDLHNPAHWLLPLAIFGLRVMDMSLDTLRVLVMVRGKKPLAWMVGFLQAFIFILAVLEVLTHLDNWLNVVAYAAGFPTGVAVGLWLEERLAVGYTEITITSPMRGELVAEKLRSEGFAVTEIPARGRSGSVTMLQLTVPRKQADEVETVVLESDPDAFITADDVRPVRRGFWRA